MRAKKPQSMKKFLLLLMLLSAGTTYAQTFEGIINWSIKSEITDPETKAKMEAAQQKMKDPANQAKMKEMQAKMNDPQFKKMMESNPQLKAQMEAMMKMSDSGESDPMTAMMPKSFQVRIKGSDVVTKMEGGIMGNMEILFLKAKDQSYRIDRPSKTYSVLPKGAAEKIASEQDVKVTKTGETTKVLGYTCTKYIVETTHKEQTAQQVLWTTTDIKGIDLKSMARQGASEGSSWYFDKVDGVPLKMEITHPHGKMVMEATELKKQSLPPSDFVIPIGFKEVQPVYGK